MLVEGDYRSTRVVLTSSGLYFTRNQLRCPPHNFELTNP